VRVYVVERKLPVSFVLLDSLGIWLKHNLCLSRECFDLLHRKNLINHTIIEGLKFKVLDLKINIDYTYFLE